VFDGSLPVLTELGRKSRSYNNTVAPLQLSSGLHVLNM
jgi:hypothetical protein